MDDGYDAYLVICRFVGAFWQENGRGSQADIKESRASKPHQNAGLLSVILRFTAYLKPCFQNFKAEILTI